MEDQELMAGVARGEDGAVREFLRRFAALITRVVRGMVRPVDVDDAVQEVLLKVWRFAGRFDVKRGSLVNWVCATAVHTAMDYRRLIEAKRRNDRLVRETRRPGPDAVETREAAGVALMSMTEHERGIYSRWAGGRSMAQIGREIGIAEGTVKSLMWKARTRARACSV